MPFTLQVEIVIILFAKVKSFWFKLKSDLDFLSRRQWIFVLIERQLWIWLFVIFYSKVTKWVFWTYFFTEPLWTLNYAAISFCNRISLRWYFYAFSSFWKQGVIAFSICPVNRWFLYGPSWCLKYWWLNLKTFGEWRLVLVDWSSWSQEKSFRIFSATFSCF